MPFYTAIPYASQRQPRTIIRIMSVRGQNWEPGELTVLEKFESATSMSFAPMIESPCSHTVAFCLLVANLPPASQHFLTWR